MPPLSSRAATPEALPPEDRRDPEASHTAPGAGLRSTLAGDAKDDDSAREPIAADAGAGDEEPEAEPEEEDAPSAFPEVSDDLVLFIFAEAGLKDQLRDIARRLNLGSEPGRLPFEAKRAVVAALMEQTAGQADGAPQAKAPPDGGRKRHSWWAFWRRG